MLGRELARIARWLIKPLFQKPTGWAAIVFGETELEMATTRSAGGEIERQPSAPLPAENARPHVDPRQHRIVTAIRGEDVLCQTVKLPTSDPAELKQMLALQIDAFIPLPVDEMVYSFEPLERTDNETRLLVAVANKATVNERVAALEAAGLPAEIVGIDTLAVFRDLVRRNVLPSDERLNALVIVGPTAVNLLIHSHGKLMAMRSLMIDDIATDAHSILKEELQRTLVAAELEQPGRATGRITFMTWHDSLRAGVAELAQGWGTDAERLGNGSSPTPSVSVCRETAQAGETQINLLPDEWRERRRTAKVRRTLIRGGITVGVVYVVALLAGLTAMAVRQAMVNNVSGKIKVLQGKYDNARTLHKTLIAMQKQLDTKYSALEVLREVTLILPENVKLNGFVFKKDNEVTLRAQAQSATLATEYISRLEKGELFSKVNTGSMRSDPGSGLTKFEVVCSLKSAVPAAATGGSWR